jgi:hypothetical protein
VPSPVGADAGLATCTDTGCVVAAITTAALVDAAIHCHRRRRVVQDRRVLTREVRIITTPKTGFGRFYVTRQVPPFYDFGMKPSECILFSGGAPGAETAFGATAESYGIEEVHFTFDGHRMGRERGIRMLNHEELQAGDVSLEYVSRLMHRKYTDAPTIRKILQTLWYQVNHGQEIYVIGSVQDDDTVRGGTGWGAEFAKLCNKPLFVFDQAKDCWLRWTGSAWENCDGWNEPVITHPHFTGTGTRQLQENGQRAIAQLFERSFGR